MRQIKSYSYLGKNKQVGENKKVGEKWNKNKNWYLFRFK